MDVRNCAKCGRLFNYIQGPPLCPSCTQALEKKFDEVKQYIYDHPQADIKEVSEACNVSVIQITQWIREERLAFSEDSLIGIKCERCGAIIKTGRFCKACKEKLTRGLMNMYPDERKKVSSGVQDYRDDARMRFLNQTGRKSDQNEK